MVVALSLAIAASISYLPVTQKLLNIVPLQPIHWVLLLIKAMVLVAIIETTKYLKNKYFKNKKTAPA